MIYDRYGRTFRTLRVSLLTHCNLGCVYCVPGEEELKKNNREGSYLPVSGLLELIGRLHRKLDLKTIRLTGGEPLLYPGLADLIAGIRSIGVPAIKLTTNGVLLERMAKGLREAGLDSVNISLDAVDEDIFWRMSRRHSLGRVINGIDSAIDAGLQVKLNAVVVKGVNESQVLPLLEFACKRQVPIRFLELMAMGHLFHRAEGSLFTQEDILGLIRSRYRITDLGRPASGTASYWKTEEGQVFGIIANESEPFCQDCDRLRLDSQGNIYGCLSSNHPIPLQPGDDVADGEIRLEDSLRAALLQKQELRFTGSDLSMLQIGG
jgi:cyclic pyranopterin phosphate synthase